MENKENEFEKDDIINPEQFQVGRAPQEEKENAEDDLVNRTDDAGYTEQEKQFADGEGTQLAEEIEATDGAEDEDEFLDEDDEELTDEDTEEEQ